jgi:hypothetical protein
MKTQIANKVVLFQETLKMTILEYPNTIKHLFLEIVSSYLQARVSFGLTWAITYIVTKTPTLVVK